MSNQLLKPELMQAVLTHGPEYVRAVGLLNEDWDPDDQPVYRNVLGASDAAVARQLQTTGVVQGRVDLTDYQAVSRLLARHPQWFSPGGQQALLKPFLD